MGSNPPKPQFDCFRSGHTLDWHSMPQPSGVMGGQSCPPSGAKKGKAGMCAEWTTPGLTFSQLWDWVDKLQVGIWGQQSRRLTAFHDCHYCRIAQCMQLRVILKQSWRGLVIRSTTRVQSKPAVTTYFFSRHDTFFFFSRHDTHDTFMTIKCHIAVFILIWMWTEQKKIIDSAGCCVRMTVPYNKCSRASINISCWHFRTTLSVFNLVP